MLIQADAAEALIEKIKRRDNYIQKLQEDYKRREEEINCLKDKVSKQEKEVSLLFEYFQYTMLSETSSCQR